MRKPKKITRVYYGEPWPPPPIHEIPRFAATREASIKKGPKQEV